MSLMTCLLSKYEYFLINDESKYDVFGFDDLCSTSECLNAFTSEPDSPPISLELKPLLDSLRCSFLGPNGSLHVTITSDLDGDEEEKLRRKP